MTVYVLHFDRPSQHARHALGSCTDLTRRLASTTKAGGHGCWTSCAPRASAGSSPAPGVAARSASASARSRAAEDASVPSASRSARLRSITRSRTTRFRARWEGGQLLAVTVENKGAVILMRRLPQMRRSP
jgi:hypothetical protein